MLTRQQPVGPRQVEADGGMVVTGAFSTLSQHTGYMWFVVIHGPPKTKQKIENRCVSENKQAPLLPALSPSPLGCLLSLQLAQLLLLRVAPSPMRVQSATLRAIWMTAVVTAANARGSTGPRSSAGVGSAPSAFVGCTAAVVAAPEPFCECPVLHAIYFKRFCRHSSLLPTSL